MATSPYDRSQTPAMRRPGFFQRVTCDSSDHYVINAVRPGAYYLLALKSGDALSMNGSAVSDDLLSRRSSTVTVQAAEVSSVDLPLISRTIY